MIPCFGYNNPTDFHNCREVFTKNYQDVLVHLQVCKKTTRGKNMNLNVMLEENASPEDLTTISEGLGVYNRAQVGPEHYRPLPVFLRDAQNWLVGGIIAST